ncbi:hypothetical protein MTR_4g103290 [Medicago truncatula]|uniref:Uncharacterized protein n=1 Tax=Medicago truncatula TaxID=3880 RepID=G7JLC3_MEDTR|nr:hypothetical protein MTR_4g103290 [Medicago truncatula]
MNHCAEVASITPSNGACEIYAPKADHNGGLGRLQRLQGMAYPNSQTFTCFMSNLTHFSTFPKVILP